MTTDELNIVVRALGTQQFQTQMRMCTTSSLKFKAAIAGITLATKKFITSALELASDLEEVQNVVHVTFGDMEDSVNAFAKNAITQFGLSETYAKKYAGTFGAMAKSFGFSTEQAMKMSTTLTGLTGDVASFYNLESDVAYTKLKSVFTGETESLKELGIVMTQTALDQYALANGYNKTTKEMNEQEKVALRYQFVMEKLKGASGDYANTSDGWANSLRTAKLQIQSMVAEIGAELMPAAKIALSYTVKGLQFISGYLKPVATGISIIAQAWVASSKSTKVFIAVATGAALALINFNKIVLLTKSVAAVVSGAVKILNMNLLTTITLSQALKGVLGVIALVAGAIGVVKMMASVSKVFDSLEESINNTQSSVGDMTSEWDSGEESVSNYTDSVKELEKSLMSFDEVNKIGDKSIIGDAVTDDALANLEQFSNMLNDVYGNMAIDTSGLESIGGIFDGLNGDISDFFDNFSNKVEETKKLWDEMINADSFEEGLESADEIVRVWLGDDWVNFWEEAGGVALDVFNEKKWRNKINIIDKFINEKFGGTPWASFWNATWGVVGDTWKVVIDLINGDSDALKLDLQRLLVKLTAIRDLWNSIVHGDKEKYERSIDVLRNGLAAIYQGPSKEGVSGYYASGGFPDVGEMFVARESGPEMVGRIGNKTAVANNEQITTAIYNAVKSALGNGGNRQGTTVLYLDGKVLGKATVDYINNQTRSVGQSPLVEIG